MIDKYQIHHDVHVLLFIRHICKLVYTGLILLLLIPHIASAEIKDGKANDIVSGIISFTQWTGLKTTASIMYFFFSPASLLAGLCLLGGSHIHRCLSCQRRRPAVAQMRRRLFRRSDVTTAGGPDSAV
ncbi:Uncharacterised protein [Pantoea agglomerans]|uniref:Uncharacterized protein n=1 Tax=Enterobacter agglomerans TaxID=549 RepID=A0A379LSK4_ENTAG|nr:Uncharacterised protein [Pantoea agglomerans]